MGCMCGFGLDIPGVSGPLPLNVDSPLVKEAPPGIMALDISYQEMALSALELLSFSVTPGVKAGSATITGTTQPSLLSTGASPWARDLIRSGRVLMYQPFPSVGVSPALAASTGKVIASSDPSTVATFAKRAGGFYVIGGDNAILYKASGLVTGQPYPPVVNGGGKKGGITNGKKTNGGDTGVAAASTTPSWVVPAIGVGAAVALIAVAVALSKKKKGPPAFGR